MPRTPRSPAAILRCPVCGQNEHSYGLLERHCESVSCGWLCCSICLFRAPISWTAKILKAFA